MSEGAVTNLMLLRSTGSKDEIQFSLNRTLRELKAVVSKSESLGKIPFKNQRIFYYGKELKNSGSSLSDLGVGTYSSFILHIHSSAATVKQMPKAAPKGNVIDLASSDSEVEGDDNECVVVEQAPKRRRRCL